MSIVLSDVVAVGVSTGFLYLLMLSVFPSLWNDWKRMVKSFFSLPSVGLDGVCAGDGTPGALYRCFDPPFWKIHRWGWWFLVAKKNGGKVIHFRFGVSVRAVPIPAIVTPIESRRRRVA